MPYRTLAALQVSESSLRRTSARQPCRSTCFLPRWFPSDFLLHLVPLIFNVIPVTARSFLHLCVLFFGQCPYWRWWYSWGLASRRPGKLSSSQTSSYFNVQSVSYSQAHTDLGAPLICYRYSPDSSFRHYCHFHLNVQIPGFAAPIFLARCRDMAYSQLASELRPPPPAGAPYSVPLSGTEEPDRTPIYRHWRFVDRELLETLDPKVKLWNSFFRGQR